LLSSGSCGLDPAAREMIQAAESAARRAANLTNQMLGFARRNLLRSEPVSLDNLVEEVVSLLRRTIDPRITVEVQKDADLWLIQADPGQMNQVLMNLCLNARDAMSNGGRLHIRTRNVCIDEEEPRHNLGARSGEFVTLEVTDTGEGMTEEVRGHIFEPFFTT